MSFKKKETQRNKGISGKFLERKGNIHCCQEKELLHLTFWVFFPFDAVPHFFRWK